MALMLKLKVTEGKLVRDPVTQTVLKEGEIYKFPKNQYWLRRLSSGEVKEFKEELKPRKKKTRKKKLEETLENGD